MVKTATTNYIDDELNMSLYADVRVAQTRQAQISNLVQFEALMEASKANEELISNPKFSEISENWEKLKLANELTAIMNQQERDRTKLFAEIKDTLVYERMLPRADVLRVVGIKSPSTVYELMREHGFPKPYIMSPGRKCWAATEVQAWLQRRMAEQRTDQCHD